MSEKRKDTKGRILKEGESQRANGTYQFRYKDVHKNAKCIYAPDLTTLRKKEEQVKRDLSDKIDSYNGGILLRDLLDKYLEIKRARIRKTTSQGYTSLINTAKKYSICQMCINKIKMSDAKRWIIQLKEDGLSYGTISTMKSIVTAALETAVDDDLIRKNPMNFRLASVIEDDTEQKTALTESDFNSVLAFMMKSGKWRKYCPMTIIMHETGVRVSELCGIVINDIDFTNKTLAIYKQLKKTQNGIYYIERPKTASGKRIIPLTDRALIAFKAAIKERKSFKTETIVDGYGGFLFLCKTGRPKTGSLIDASFATMMKEYNSENKTKLVMTPHSLRHTFCTNLAEAGLPVKDLQYLMGHADASTTMDTYTHPNFDAVKNNFYKAKLAQ